MVGTISFRRPCSCKPPTYENSCCFFHHRKCAYVCAAVQVHSVISNVQ